MASAGNITAVLTLNSSGFQKGLTESLSKVQNFSNSINKLGTSTGGLKALNGVLDGVVGSLSRVDGVSKQNLNTLSRLSTAINKMANGLKILQSDTVNVDLGINTMNSIFKAFQGTLNGTEIKVKGVSTVIKEMANSERQSASTTNQVAVATQQYDKALELALPPTRNLITGTRELANAQNQLQAEERETSGAVNQATNSMNRQATASKGLGRAMSSLRMMGSMVGSMIAYNFVHNLAMATTETINAKSEMNGYFQMLGYTKGQVADFNQELDKTVQLFPRLNKYSLGETISSIGVEFELTTEEMKKAMPVVSMITSEYLRAGRNVNEASLAVKDILQGEFQRLSRETGVKGEDLIEAGWSGDKNDVMGLLEALDKVGKSRNWDTFVQKANSLNDAVLILQNRFSEWSADMVERIQPSIVHAFNTIMSVASLFGDVLNGALNWLSGDGLGQSIVKWGGLATALIGVTTALIHLRTGANLTQIAQMGLTRSIGATVLGLEAETVAETGLRNAIVQSITGLEAETLAENLNVSSRRARLLAITSTITGLEAEEVAQIGVTKSLGASLLGLDMATLKEHGFAVALAESTTQMEAQELASMGLIKQIGLIGATTIPAIAVVGAFAVAFSKLAMETMNATAKMGKFYDIQQHGKEYVDEAKDGVTNLKNKINDLKDTQSKYTKGSKEYQNVGKAIDDLNGKVDLANKNVDANYEAWQKVNSAQKNYDTTKQELQLDLQQKINKALIDTGLSEKEANELSNNRLNDAIDGSEQLYKALQSVSLQYTKQAQGVAGLTEYWKSKGLSPEEIKVKIDPYIDSQNAIAEDIEKMKLSTDIIEVASTWGKLQIDQWDNAWKENLPKIEAGDWLGGLEGLGKGLLHFLDDLPVFHDFWAWIFEHTGVTNYRGKGLDFFKDGFIYLLTHGLDGFNTAEFLGDIGTKIIEGLSKTITDGIRTINLFESISDWISSSIGNFDILGMITNAITNSGNGGTGGGITKKIDIGALIKNLFSLGDGVDFSWATDFVNNNIIVPLQTAWNEFMTNPVAYIGDALGISSLINGLLGVVDSADFSWATEFINTNIITPLSTAWNEFMADPISFITTTFSVGSLLSALTIGDDGTSILTWVNDNVVTPLSNGIVTGIANIPIIGSIAQMLGLVPSEGQDAYDKGYNLIDNLKRGVQQKIGEIPIVGDIARMLGLIPQENGDAHDKGHGIGDNIKRGEAEGHKGIADNVRDEMGNVITAISNKFGEAYSTAHDIGSQILNGIKDALDMHSPSIISRELIADEFGVYIPNAIRDSGDTAYNTAMEYGQAIKDGISATTFNTTGFDSAVGVYEDDAQMVAQSSELMGVTTTTAFNDMTLAVNQTTSTMSGNVATTYTGMQQKQQSSLNTMKNQNLQAYNDMYLKSNQSLIQMRDSTSNVTHQMVNAWDHMKNQIIASANKLKNDSTSHFNQLSNTIGSFYRKIQNPSNWGAGTGGTPTRSARHPTQGKSIARMMTRTASHHGAGVSPYTTGGTGKTMTLRALKNMVCPSGDCGIFDGYDLSQKVNVDEFLALIGGEHGFGWNDWSGKHYNYIKSTSDQWGMKSPVIQLAGGIPTNADYKVGDFENGTPHISFDAFQSMAESIFSVIPYKFYYDSNWKGSWLGALQAGACNCSDGADALIAFASACGFSGYKQHTTTKSGIGHFYAVINGKAMDTTHFQNSGSWTPLGGAGIPTRTANPSAGVYPQGNKTVNVNVEISGTVYGVDDLDSKIQESVQEGLRAEFNDPYTVAI